MAQRAMCHPSIRKPFVVVNEPEPIADVEEPVVAPVKKKASKKKSKSDG